MCVGMHTNLPDTVGHPHMLVRLFETIRSQDSQFPQTSAGMVASSKRTDGVNVDMVARLAHVNIGMV